MENRKIKSKKRYVLAFIIGTLIFILGFVLTYSFSYIEYQRISNVQSQISYEIFNDKLDSSLFGEDICSVESFRRVSEDLGFQGRIIDDLERKFGKQDKRVLFRKQFYTLIELEHFEFVKEINEKCSSDIQTILFFYSNDEKIIGEAETAGELLGAVSSRNQNLVIYSFDIDLKSDLITSLKEKYEIKEPLTIIINEQNIVIAPENILEIEKYLQSNSYLEQNSSLTNNSMVIHL